MARLINLGGDKGGILKFEGSHIVFMLCMILVLMQVEAEVVVVVEVAEVAEVVVEAEAEAGVVVNPGQQSDGA
ncbi:hypothetical protein L2E82_25620 [Cichorium intybus]|uniref:Uncharacterized protein n=1 Tax=Cichorium intybus TaxID=13427 RepID=A0ACB9E3L4_CICIN|nr:hypothetical protein L2E82_25620 [Cichorium intybus]